MHTLASPLLSLFCIIAIMSCGSSSEDPSRDPSDSTADTSSSSAEPRWEVREDFNKYFAAAGVTGAFLLYDPQKNLYLTNDTARSRTQFCPASTFKIFNSLVFLETGVIRDENEPVPWDSTVRNIDTWNRDHTLRSAIENSVVWFYQELARRVGRERLQSYLDTVGYGNRKIGDSVETFWLDGSLRISPVEQIQFLERLHRNELPFSRRTMDIVREIIIRKKTDAYTYRGKTGWALRKGMNIGWFVGYLERGKEVYFFAANIDMKGEETLNARVEIPWNVLRDMKLVEE